MSKTYRTLVRGKLRQLTALCVGGAANDPGGADLQCAKDGKGRLTIPGSGQAGALIETAGRIFPSLFDERIKKDANTPGNVDEWFNRITSKQTKLKARSDSDETVRQSLWQFSPSHLAVTTPEMRQGVGIRQATGATASEAKALFDVETIPAGAVWDFFFEIDALRGGDKVEAVAMFALWEWTQGRCWLGANAARGLGNMKLEGFEILRLPADKKAIEAWPDVTRDRNDPQFWDALKTLAGSEVITDNETLRKKAELLWHDQLPIERFWYAAIDATFAAGKDPDGYGWDTLSVGGHAAGLLEPSKEELVVPTGVDAVKFREVHTPDCPVVMTQSVAGKRPFVPGSGVRGPLRHATSRIHNTATVKVRDPNTIEARLAKDGDPVSQLFGLALRSGRLLVGDAGLEGDAFRLVCLQHHAEDEFTAGVYGSGKFDRTAVLEGKFRVRLVIEAATNVELLKHLETLRSALTLAELGFVALGGGKWRGHGWLKWTFDTVAVGQAGSNLEAMNGDKVAAKLNAAMAKIGGGA